MCGIAGILELNYAPFPSIPKYLDVMNRLQAHRGPDGEGFWIHSQTYLGLAHLRLSIIDLTTGDQPMSDEAENVIIFNGEIYNYIELRQELRSFGHSFKTTSDTEVILKSYQQWGKDCISHLRGMFAFAIWDEQQKILFCGRDRFGIKPFYYTIQDNVCYFASEVKALLPFLPQINTNRNALKEYLYFQLLLSEETLFEGINELPPAHSLTIANGSLIKQRYWEVYYHLDFDHTPKYFEEKLRFLLEDAIHVHTRSDVPIGAYISGGIDSGIVGAITAQYKQDANFQAFTGKFSLGDLYDESHYARSIATKYGMQLHEIDINSQDFVDTIHKVIYHLDYPVAGPGSFPQYHVSKLASKHRKVVLGGQGGDEIFGGYTRYLVAYFEQCIKGAIDGNLYGGNFIVTYESIIPNLVALQNYKPMMKDFFKDGLFDTIEKRYFRLINRSQDLKNEINWGELGDYSPFDTFKTIFEGQNVGKESYFDKMTHFDFKTLLPALLQVEDRMSMAHSIESRVPFLDHPLIEFAATMPSNVKFKDGTLKMILVNAMKDVLPNDVVSRKNKMGFPVPLNEWLQKDLKEFINDLFHSQRFKYRSYFNQEEILKGLNFENKFGRKIWGLLSLEIWHQNFHDQQANFKRLII
jgi:asparagine synthase (glutamine-hydrolysing)